MTRFTCLAVAVLAAAPNFAAAQTATQSSGSNKATQSAYNQAAIQRGTAVTSTRSAMYEDIEIMRRILLRQLRAHQQAFCVSCHSSGTAITFTQPTTGDAVASGLIDLGAAVGMPSNPPANRNVLVDSNGLSYEETYKDFLLYFPVHAPQNNRKVHVSQPAIDIDGTYLVDYGVVFHIAMPAMGTAPAKMPNLAVFSADSGLDDWDRIRREVRGDGPDKPKNTEKQKPVDVTDVLLRVMAENGRHFSKLSEKEKLTIIVSFRSAFNPHANVGRSFLNELLPALDPRGPWTAPQTSIPAAPTPFSSTFSSTTRTPQGPSATGASQGQSTTTAATSGIGGTTTSGIGSTTTRGVGSTTGTSQQSAAITASSGMGDFELLGDLQAKQGKVQEAIQAYERAVELQPDAPRKSGLYRKLAEAYLKSSGKSDAVTKAIDYLQRAQKNIAMPTQERKDDASNKDREPQASKLIITAPKTLLDAAKTISPEEFRKAVHVEGIPVAQATPTKMLAPVRRMVQG